VSRGHDRERRVRDLEGERVLLDEEIATTVGIYSGDARRAA
jgi:hypothetical protein